MITLGHDSYRRKVYGCWLGKTVGGTLGQPHEGKRQLLELTFYDPVPTGAIANDDLDLQLVWLAALRASGPATDERVLGQAWRDWLQYPFDEYGIAEWNLHRGLEPPVSGQFANDFSHCMGAPIRSEIWACVAPGMPGLAAEYAYCDGCVDHGGEGIWGEIFFAAIEAACFVTDDRERLLDLGLAMIPADCRTAGAVRLTRRLYAEGVDWLAARTRILDQYGHVNFTDAPQNIAFTILGWLWGEDAGDAMCKAVNCGYDTDCTGATLGSILGLIHGPEVFDRKWVEPVGDEVVVGWGVTGCEVPRDLGELTDWTIELAKQVLEAHDAPFRIGETTSELPVPEPTIPPTLAARLVHHDWTLRQPLADGVAWIGLNKPPALEPHESRTIDIRTERPVTITCEPPAGWEATIDGGSVVVTAPGNIADQPCHRLPLRIDDTASAMVFVPACGWRVAGPVTVAEAAAALDSPPPMGVEREVWTPDHRLVLDEGAEQDRVYRIRARLALTESRDARLVAATPELQKVAIDGVEAIVKRSPTRFIPAPHRSGPGTVVEAQLWPAEGKEIEILLACRAGERAELHLYLTRSRDVDGPRMVPWGDQMLRLP